MFTSMELKESHPTLETAEKLPPQRSHCSDEPTILDVGDPSDVVFLKLIRIWQVYQSF